MVNYTYKFRLYPNKEQEVLLSKHFGCCRFIYNYFLDQRVNAYLNDKKTLNYYDNAKELTQLKKQENTIWLKEVSAQSLQYALNCLGRAYRRFFAQSAKFPKFKNRRGKQSFCISQYGKIKNNRLHIARFREGIKIKLHREIEGKIKHITVSRNSSGQCFACICVEREIKHLPPKNKVVGIDLGIKTLAIQSDGKTYPNIKPYHNLEARMTKLQQWLARTTKGSKHRERIRKRIAKLHQYIKNIRNNHLNKVSWRMVKNNGIIVFEDLNVKSMMKNHCLAKSIMDVSWAELVRMVKYKAKWYGREFIQVDRWFPSSKTCNNCNYIKQDLILNDREWICARCEAKHDRDLNAAKNIRQQGIALLKQTTVGTTGMAWGAEVRLEGDKVSLKSILR